MRKTGKKKWVVLGVGATGVALIPVGFWVMLTLQPSFYRQLKSIPPEVRHAEAQRFVAQSLQLRNDIRNEPNWEAIFSDQEVNAWLAEDLVTQFADQIPPGVQNPRVAFEKDRLTLAFELDQGPIRSVVWVVAAIKVPQENALALTLEKVRAGLVPVPMAKLVAKIDEYATSRGFEVEWEHDPNGPPTAILRYAPDVERSDIVLEKILVRPGELRLSGRSDRSKGEVAMPNLPGRAKAQSARPGRNTSDQDPAVPATAQSSIKPKS